MSEYSKSAVLKRYPSDVKCGLCGKTAGNHNASTAGCPFGKRDRTGGYSFSSTQFFSPKRPRLKKNVIEAVSLLVNTLNNNHQEARKVQTNKTFTAEEREAIALSLIQDMDFAYWKLFSSILEQNDATPKPKRFVI